MLWVLSLAIQAAVALALSVSGKDVLVLFDPRLNALETIEPYTSLLQAQGLNVHIADISTTDPALSSSGVYHYDHVLVLPTKQRKLGKDITGAKLVEFFNDGGDVLAVTSPQGVSEAVRTFLNELDIYPSPKGHQLVDRFNHGEDDTIVKLTKENFLTEIVTPEEIEYQGSSALISNNAQLVPFVQASSTSFSKSSKDEDQEWTVGKEGYLSVGFQGRNGARVSWTGDLSSLTKELSQWTYQSQNILKTKYHTHSHVDGTPYEVLPYKIKDDVHYEIALQEFDGTKWGPYIAESAQDVVQLEIRLLDPYHRLNLTLKETTEDAAVYEADFKLPDHHGVFSFVVDYKRLGYNFIEEKTTLSIRHLANDEYPRSWDISNSWVYVTSSFVVFAGWFVFLLTFIYAKDTTLDSKKEK